MPTSLLDYLQQEKYLKYQVRKIYCLINYSVYRWMLGLLLVLHVVQLSLKKYSVIQHELEHHHYDVVLSIGQAGGRFNITPERVGINKS